jgi:hypothetical protein
MKKVKNLNLLFKNGRFYAKNSLKIYFFLPKLTGNLLLCNNYIDQLNFIKKKLIWEILDGISLLIMSIYV